MVNNQRYFEFEHLLNELEMLKSGIVSKCYQSRIVKKYSNVMVRNILKMKSIL